MSIYECALVSVVVMAWLLAQPSTGASTNSSVTTNSTANSNSTISTNTSTTISNSTSGTNSSASNSTSVHPSNSPTNSTTNNSNATYHSNTTSSTNSTSTNSTSLHPSNSTLPNANATSHNTTTHGNSTEGTNMTLPHRNCSGECPTLTQTPELTLSLSASLSISFEETSSETRILGTGSASPSITMSFSPVWTFSRTATRITAEATGYWGSPASLVYNSRMYSTKFPSSLAAHFASEITDLLGTHPLFVYDGLNASGSNVRVLAVRAQLPLFIKDMISSSRPSMRPIPIPDTAVLVVFQFVNIFATREWAYLAYLNRLAVAVRDDRFLAFPVRSVPTPNETTIRCRQRVVMIGSSIDCWISVRNGEGLPVNAFAKELNVTLRPIDWTTYGSVRVLSGQRIPQTPALVLERSPTFAPTAASLALTESSDTNYNRNYSGSQLFQFAVSSGDLASVTAISASLLWVPIPADYTNGYVDSSKAVPTTIFSSNTFLWSPVLDSPILVRTLSSLPVISPYNESVDLPIMGSAFTLSQYVPFTLTVTTDVTDTSEEASSATDDGVGAGSGDVAAHVFEASMDVKNRPIRMHPMATTTTTSTLFPSDFDPQFITEDLLLSGALFITNCECAKVSLVELDAAIAAVTTPEVDAFNRNSATLKLVNRNAILILGDAGFNLTMTVTIPDWPAPNRTAALPTSRNGQTWTYAPMFLCYWPPSAPASYYEDIIGNGHRGISQTAASFQRQVRLIGMYKVRPRPPEEFPAWAIIIICILGFAFIGTWIILAVVFRKRIRKWVSNREFALLRRFRCGRWLLQRLNLEQKTKTKKKRKKGKKAKNEGAETEDQKENGAEEQDSDKDQTMMKTNEGAGEADKNGHDESSATEKTTKKSKPKKQKKKKGKGKATVDENEASPTSGSEKEGGETTKNIDREGDTKASSEQPQTSEQPTTKRTFFDRGFSCFRSCFAGCVSRLKALTPSKTKSKKKETKRKTSRKVSSRGSEYSKNADNGERKHSGSQTRQTQPHSSTSQPQPSSSKTGHLTVDRLRTANASREGMESTGATRGPASHVSNVSSRKPSGVPSYPSSPGSAGEAETAGGAGIDEISANAKVAHHPNVAIAKSSEPTGTLPGVPQHQSTAHTPPRAAPAINETPLRRASQTSHGKLTDEPPKASPSASQHRSSQQPQQQSQLSPPQSQPQKSQQLQQQQQQQQRGSSASAVSSSSSSQQQYLQHQACPPAPKTPPSASPAMPQHSPPPPLTTQHTPSNANPARTPSPAATSPTPTPQKSTSTGGGVASRQPAASSSAQPSKSPSSSLKNEASSQKPQTPSSSAAAGSTASPSPSQSAAKPKTRRSGTGNIHGATAELV